MKLCIPLAYALVFAGGVGAQPVVITGLRQPQSLTGNGLIEGTVINEITHVPVRKAQVTLGSANAPPAVTDATGRFAFRNLGPGTYWLQASHPLFPQPARVTQSSPLSVTLGQDEQKHDLVIALTPGATINGSVSDEDGTPLAGCSVQELGFQLGQPDRKLSAWNSAEMKEKKARVEDAMHATRAAVEEGIVPGGGVALLRAATTLEKLDLSGEEKVGVNVLKRACEEPLRQIVQNSGREGAVVVEKVRSHQEANYGFNAATDQYEDLVKAGVIDPTKVTRTALQNAASIASLMLTTEAMICEMPEEPEP